MVGVHHRLERTPVHTDAGDPNQEWLAAHERNHIQRTTDALLAVAADYP